MNEADVWRALIPTLRTGLDAAGYNSILIAQSYQPTQQGVSSDDIVYIHKVTSKRYGHQGVNLSYDSGNNIFDKVESYWLEATFQLDAVINRDITDSSSYTAYDIVDYCAAWLQTQSARETLLNSGIGILRISDIRNPYTLDDHGKYDQNSNFDFVLSYKQSINSIVPVADPVGDYYRV